jgi:SAM-dependent methyltransferase
VSRRRRQQRDWDDLAAFDPWRAILRDPSRERGWEVDEFLATGERDAERVLAAAAEHGLPRRFGRAFDFGCGVGRMTRALARRFDEVVGMDISPRMVELARRLNRDSTTARFVVGGESEVNKLPDAHFDLVVCVLVLQHLRSRREAERVVTALTRTLAAGGALVLQAPYRLPARRRVQLRRRAYTLLRGFGVTPARLLGRFRLDPIRTVALSEAAVAGAVERAGGNVVATWPDDATGPHVPSRRYLVTRV